MNEEDATNKNIKENLEALSIKELEQRAAECFNRNSWNSALECNKEILRRQDNQMAEDMNNFIITEIKNDDKACFLLKNYLESFLKYDALPEIFFDSIKAYLEKLNKFMDDKYFDLTGLIDFAIKMQTQQLKRLEKKNIPLSSKTLNPMMCYGVQLLAMLSIFYDERSKEAKSEAIYIQLPSADYRHFFRENFCFWNGIMLNNKNHYSYRWKFKVSHEKKRPIQDSDEQKLKKKERRRTFLADKGAIISFGGINGINIAEDKFLGGGGFGSVFAGTWKDKNIAFKRLLKQELDEKLERNIMREAQIMADCHSPYIVEFYGICMNPFGLVMELLADSLYSLLHASKISFDWSHDVKPWNMAEDIAKGLTYLHSMEIMHRDIKSPNVLLDENRNPKLGDFGSSKARQQANKDSIVTLNVGTVSWNAPETFEDDPIYTFSGDIWSLGLVLWEMLTNKIPYEKIGNAIKIQMAIMNGKKEEIPENCPEELRKILEDCWKDRENRPTAPKIVEALSQAKEITLSPSKIIIDKNFKIQSPKPRILVENSQPNKNFYYGFGSEWLSLFEKAENKVKCIRVVFPRIENNGDNKKVFMYRVKQLKKMCLMMGKPAIFVFQKPGFVCHLLCGILKGEELLLIDPFGGNTFDIKLILDADIGISRVLLSQNMIQNQQFSMRSQKSDNTRIIIELLHHLVARVTSRELENFWKSSIINDSQENMNTVNIRNLLSDDLNYLELLSKLNKVTNNRYGERYKEKIKQISEEFEFFGEQHDQTNENFSQKIFNALLTEEHTHIYDLEAYQLLKKELACAHSENNEIRVKRKESKGGIWRSASAENGLNKKKTVVEHDIKKLRRISLEHSLEKNKFSGDQDNFGIFLSSPRQHMAINYVDKKVVELLEKSLIALPENSELPELKKMIFIYLAEGELKWTEIYRMFKIEGLAPNWPTRPLVQEIRYGFRLFILVNSRVCGENDLGLLKSLYLDLPEDYREAFRQEVSNWYTHMKSNNKKHPCYILEHISISDTLSMQEKNKSRKSLDNKQPTKHKSFKSRKKATSLNDDHGLLEENKININSPRHEKSKRKHTFGRKKTQGYSPISSPVVSPTTSPSTSPRTSLDFESRNGMIFAQNKEALNHYGFFQESKLSLPTYICSLTFSLSAEINCICPLWDNKAIACGLTNGKIVIFDISDFSKGGIEKVSWLAHSYAAVTDIVFLPESQQLISVAMGDIPKAWSIDKNEMKVIEIETFFSESEYKQNIVSMALIDKNQLLTVDKKGLISIGNLKGQKCAKPDSVITDSTDIHAISCIASLENNRIISGYSNGALKVWHHSSYKKFERQTSWNGHLSRPVNYLALASSNIIFSASVSDNVIEILDMETRQSNLLRKHKANISGLATVFSEGIVKVISVDVEGQLKVWQVESSLKIENNAQQIIENNLDQKQEKMRKIQLK